jgi:predicted HTH transcriptional regulator
VTPDELDILREGWDFEAKLAAGRDGQGALPESLWETYSAMANTEGGVIVLGAKELPDGSLQPQGIVDIDKVERDLWNILENPQKVSANLLRRDDVRRIDLDGRALLVLQVPKAPRSQRPVHLNGSWEKKTYLRVHEGDRVADREVARRMLADAQPDHDAQVLEGYAEADFHAESVRQYRQLLASMRPDHPFLREDNAGFLWQIGALGRDRLRKTEGVTLGGLMMLGREDAIRDRFPHWHLSYRELPADTAAGPRWLDRIAPDGTWNANVFEFYSRVILKLHQGLKVPFALDANQFRNDESPATPRSARR